MTQQRGCPSGCSGLPWAAFTQPSSDIVTRFDRGRFHSFQNEWALPRSGKINQPDGRRDAFNLSGQNILPPGIGGLLPSIALSGGAISMKDSSARSLGGLRLEDNGTRKAPTQDEDLNGQIPTEHIEVTGFCAVQPSQLPSNWVTRSYSPPGRISNRLIQEKRTS